jgi:hypothetical protein
LRFEFPKQLLTCRFSRRVSSAAELFVLGGYAAENRGADFVQRRDSAEIGNY